MPQGFSLQRYGDLLRTRDAVIFGLAKLAESRDPDTGNHLERIAVYSTRLATVLRRNPRYRRHLTPAFVKLIGISSALHDIGKVGIEDSILLKPGQFEEQERLVMHMHAAIGGKCIREIESRLGRSNFLQMAREIAFCHHERWDGRGYPDGLAGEEIPLAARIVAVADVYDALATKRVYKAAFPHGKCVEMIRAEAGKQFDPGGRGRLPRGGHRVSSDGPALPRGKRNRTRRKRLFPEKDGDYGNDGNDGRREVRGRRQFVGCL